MSKYKELLEKYEQLERKYTEQTAENLDLKYRLDELTAEYENSRDKQQEIELLHENTRRLKHDMKNHIMVIASHLNSGETEQAKEYLSVVLDNLNRVYSYIRTGNSVLNYIINTKLEYAQQNGTTFKAEIENLPFEKMGSVDFSAVLGNMLDNAIEASLSETDKYIYVSVCKKRGWDTITVKNKIERSVLSENPDLTTTKHDKEKHGVGVAQIKTISEKYGGMVDIYENEGMFCVSVMIPSE